MIIMKSVCCSYWRNIFKVFFYLGIYKSINLFLFIFVLFKYTLYKNNVGFSAIWSRIVAVEGKCADHLTTTTAQSIKLSMKNIVRSEIYFCQSIRQRLNNPLTASWEEVSSSLYVWPLIWPETNTSKHKCYKLLQDFDASFGAQNSWYKYL